MPTRSGSSEVCFPDCRVLILGWVITGWKGARELYGISFLRALIPFRSAPASWPWHFPKTSPLNTILLSGRFFTYEFGGGEHKQQTSRPKQSSA